MQTPILTIITVCRQAKNSLKKTLCNVLEQTEKNFECLIIDGGSDDGTIGLLEELTPVFSHTRIPFRFLSEPDHGIYDAMNKGVRMAEGKWLLFLNAGDLLADPHVLERVFQKHTDAQIIYGDTLCTYQSRARLYPALPPEHLAYEMAFCHQSAFILKSLLLERPYDITYQVCADHHFFLSAYLQNRVFEYRPFPISIYEISGYSDQHPMAGHREQRRMQKELGVFHFSFSWLIRECSFYGKQAVKRLFGQKLIDAVRRKNLQ